MTRLLMNAMDDYNSGKVAPDTIGADYFFLDQFMTYEMEYDFVAIEIDFLEHCRERLDEFNKVGWYGDEEHINYGPGLSVKKRIIRLIYNGAKLKDEMCIILYHALNEHQITWLQYIDDDDIGIDVLNLDKELLKTRNPEREYTYEEVQHYAAVYNLVEALTDAADVLEEQVAYLTGENPAEDMIDDALFDAKNIVLHGQTKKKHEEQNVITNIAPVSTGDVCSEEYLKEIADLRRKLNEKEQENKALVEQCRQLKKVTVREPYFKV